MITAPMAISGAGQRTAVNRGEQECSGLGLPLVHHADGTDFDDLATGGDRPKRRE